MAVGGQALRLFGSSRPVLPSAVALVVLAVFVALTTLEIPTVRALQVGPVSPVSQGIDSN